MGADISRIRHNPLLDFTGVDLQQGRVLDDASVNEMMAIIDRRVRALASDTLGRAMVSSTTPNAFKIEASGGTFTIDRGRMYVDGHKAENHGGDGPEFDPLLAEPRRKGPVPYDEQPYAPRIEPLPNDQNQHLVFLDVWDREVTYLEHPDLIEPAIGVDTTTRTQTVWQVRLLENVGADTTCGTPDDQLPAWVALTRPAAGRLSSHALGVAPELDPCKMPPTGGFRGLENQTYRVEIHDGGGFGTATFKWSRDQACIASSVTAMNSTGTEVTVASIGRDAVLRFNTGDLVEVTDDWREFERRAGVIGRVTVDDATSTLTLSAALPADLIPAGIGTDTLAGRHTRVRRWDQHGEVRDDQDTLIVDLDAAGSTGVIPIDTAGQKIRLEDGLAVDFTLDPDIAGGEFRAGDYWVLAARTIGASVELLEAAPPRGIHHHYARLALVTFPDGETDCRPQWPPESGGEGCACTVCVTPESHASGALTIQKAIDQIKATGGTVCLAAGVYQLGETPVAIDDAQSVRLTGQGSLSVITANAAAIAVSGSADVTLDRFTVISAGQQDAVEPVISFHNVMQGRLERCLLAQGFTNPNAAGAVALGGVVMDIAICDNGMVGPAGVRAPFVRNQKQTYLASIDLAIERNIIMCGQRGVALDGPVMHYGGVAIRDNVILGAANAGISATGATLAGTPCDITGNRLGIAGRGIVVGVDGARVEGNDIFAAENASGGDGIELATGLDVGGLDRGHVSGNRVVGVGGDGIAITGTVRSAMITQNVIEGVGGVGIAMRDKGSVDTLTIAGNHLLNIMPREDPDDGAAGIRIVGVGLAQIADNLIRGVGVNARQGLGRFGIQAFGTTTLQVSGNEIVEIGPPEDYLGPAIGIHVLAPFERTEIANNDVRRHATTIATQSDASWVALQVGPIEGLRQRVSRKISMVAADEQVHVIVAGDFVFLLVAGTEVVAVRGNNLESRSARTACVIVSGKGDCLLTDNVIVQTSPTGTFTARVAGSAVIANANRIRGPEFSLAIDANPRRVTVLGNIVQAGIAVAGGPLDPKWQDLNVTNAP